MIRGLAALTSADSQRALTNWQPRQSERANKNPASGGADAGRCGALGAGGQKTSAPSKRNTAGSALFRLPLKLWRPRPKRAHQLVKARMISASHASRGRGATRARRPPLFCRLTPFRRFPIVFASHQTDPLDFSHSFAGRKILTLVKLRRSVAATSM
jgi:hypothetical protein